MVVCQGVKDEVLVSSGFTSVYNRALRNTKRLVLHSGLATKQANFPALGHSSDLLGIGHD